MLNLKREAGMIANMSLLPVPSPQVAANKYMPALRTPDKLLSLHPRSVGHPGNHAALNPAIVLSSISAFEGFAEDFAAISLAKAGAGFAEIASTIGKWNNPTLADFAERMKWKFPSASAGIDAPFEIEIFHYSKITSTAPVLRKLTWKEVLEQSKAWMQVRHCLTHGLTTGWRAERWPPPLNNDPAATTVLRARRDNNHALGIHNAISCARIYSIGAIKIADAVATTQGASLDWQQMPTFD